MKGVRSVRSAVGALMVLALVAILAAGCSSGATPAAQAKSSSAAKPAAAASGLKQTSEAGNVTIDVTWDNPTAAPSSPVRFSVELDTHSVDLDAIDLGKVAVLRNDRGVEAKPAEWNAPAGGHHRAGKLVFTSGSQPVLGPEVKAIELVIRDVAGIKERTLRWAVPQ